MNRYFEDTRYYLKRAGETAKKGVEAELQPIRERFQAIVGEEEEPAPGRFDDVRAELEEVQTKAEGEAREAIAEARGKLAEYRQSRAN